MLLDSRVRVRVRVRLLVRIARLEVWRESVPPKRRIIYLVDLRHGKKAPCPLFIVRGCSSVQFGAAVSCGVQAAVSFTARDCSFPHRSDCCSSVQFGAAVSCGVQAAVSFTARDCSLLHRSDCSFLYRSGLQPPLFGAATSLHR